MLRLRDSDVAEHGPLGDGVVMGAHEQTDVNRIGERHTGESLRHERIPESRHRQDVLATPPLELDHRVGVGKTVGRLVLLGDPTTLPAELERHQTIAMERGSHVRATRVERGTNGPAGFAMRLNACPNEPRTRGEDEVAADPLPDEMKVVAGIPHVLPRPGDGIHLLLRVVRRGTCRAAHIRMRGKDADGALSPEDTSEDRGAQSHGHSRYSVLGNAIASRMCGMPQIHATVRSPPKSLPHSMSAPSPFSFSTASVYEIR